MQRGTSGYGITQRSQRILLAILLLAAGGWLILLSKSTGLPQGAVNAVLAELEIVMPYGYRGFTLEDSRRLELSDADLRSAVEEKWCLGFRVEQLAGESSEEWQEVLEHRILVRKGRVWMVAGYPDTCQPPHYTSAP